MASDKLPFEAYQGHGEFIFASYSHADRAGVYEELIHLKAEGFNLWYDEGITPAHRWSEELADAIDGCSVFLAFITPHFVASDHCIDEIEYALRHGLPVLVVLLEPTELPHGLELGLGSRQAIHRHEHSEAIFQEKLVRSLRMTLQSGRTEVDSTCPPAETGRSRFRSFVERRVFRAAAMYVAVAWGITEISAFLAEALWGDSIADLRRYIAILFIAGFPVAMYLAWVRDLGHRARRIATAATLAIFVVAALVWQLPTPRDDGPDGHSTSPRDIDPRSIAVLPFVDLSGNPDQDYLSDGITEELIHRLSQLSGLHVAARTSSFYFKGKSVPISTVGRELQVASVLEGSVRKSDDRLRVTVQLIDVRTGYHIWSRTIERGIDDIFSIQDEISSKVVESLRLSLIEEEEVRLTRRPTSNLDAYDYYLQARSMLARADDEERYRRASHFFSRAVEIDPEFARALAGRCEAELAIYRYSRDVERILRAEDDCRLALSIEPDLVEVRIALTSLYRASGQLARADEEIQIALDQFPEDPDVYRALAWVRSDQKDIDGAVRAYRRSIEIAPEDVRPYQDLGRLLFAIGRYDASAEAYSDMVDASGGSAAAYNGLGAALLMQGRFDEAAAAFRSVLERQPNPRAFSNVAVNYYHSGRYEEAELMFREAIALSPDDYRLIGNLADALRQIPGREQHAREEYLRAAELAEEIRRANPGDVEALSSLGHFYAQIGKIDSAQQAAEAALAADPGDVYAHYYGALVWLESGDEQRVLKELSTAIELGYSPAMLRADPQFQPMAQNQQFQTLLAHAN